MWVVVVDCGVFSIGVGHLVTDIGVGVGTDCAIFGITVGRVVAADCGGL